MELQFNKNQTSRRNTPLTIQAISVFAFIVVLIYMALRSSGKIEDETDYIVAGRKLPLYLAWGTLLATWYGASSVLGTPDNARYEGLNGNIILDPLACGACLVLTGIFLAGRVWKLELLTTGDLFAKAYGKKTEIVSSFIQSISYLPWIAGQYLALAGVFHSIIGLPVFYGILLAAAIVLLLTITGGMWSVTTTDTVQIIVVIVCLVMIFIEIVMRLGNGSFINGFNHILEKTEPSHLTLLPQATSAAILGWLGIWSTGLFGNLPGQDLMQRVFASKSPATARNACILAGVVYIVLGFLPVILGLASRLMIQGEDKKKVILELANIALSPFFQILFLIAVVGAVISTGTSAILSPACLIGKNFLQRFSFWKFNTLTTTKICVVIVTLASIPFAMLSDSIIELLDQALAISMVSVCIPFVVAIFSRKQQGDLRGTLAVLSGTLSWLIHFVVASYLPETEYILQGDNMNIMLNLIKAFPPEFTGFIFCGMVMLIFPMPRIQPQPQPAQSIA